MQLSRRVERIEARSSISHLRRVKEAIVFRHLRPRPGVSALVVALLLVVIATAAAVVAHNLVVSFLSSSTTTSTGGQARIVVDQAEVTLQDEKPVVKVYVRNVGNVPVHVTHIYLIDVNGTLINASPPSNGRQVLVDAGDVKVVESQPLTKLPSSKRYFMVKVTTAEGAMATSLPMPLRLRPGVELW
ncbi:MAG: hypothetical protein DRJ97_07965, partial [Thermoprotei archaeon]